MFRASPPTQKKFQAFPDKCSGQYTIFNQKSLHRYLSQFGKSHEKFIPAWVKRLPEELLQLFLATFSQGDGDKAHVKYFWTTSSRMAQDLSEIITLLGEAPVISMRDRVGTVTTLPNSKYTLHHNYPLYCVSIMDIEYASNKKTWN